jgi:alanyl-tRNA synthetase
MTEQLYYTDPRLTDFEARLLHQKAEGNRWAVILDRTAFYPEGGGQPADRGTLNGVPVLDVQKQGDEIRHYLAEPLPEETAGQETAAEGAAGGTGVRGIAPGGAAIEETCVRGTIDWARRFEFMQQHTGQHIISASLIEAAGYRTISAYLGDRYTAVEIDTDAIQEKEIEAAETLANQVVTRNRPVQIHWIRPEEAEHYHLRKPPPDVERLRIVHIEGVDAAACAGIHVAATGEVGLIKYDGLEKIRGRLRLHWLIGQRAYRDTREKDRLAAALNRELTCGTEDILISVQDLRNKIREREQRIAQLEKALAEQRVRELLERAETRRGVRLILECLSPDESSYAQTVYQNLLDRPKTVACIILHRDEVVQWRIGCSEDLDLPWKQILPGLFPLIDGKGGGRGRSWQGLGGNPEGVERFLAALGKALRDQLPGGTDG